MDSLPIATVLGLAVKVTEIRRKAVSQSLRSKGLVGLG